MNAIYFKADWAAQFRKAYTRPADFTSPGKPAFKVPMMVEELPARYMENDDFQLAELMYKGGDVSMVVILPKKPDGLLEVEKKLSAKALADSLAAADKTEVAVSLPKFKMTEAFVLNNDLAKLGMMDAFSPAAADFTGISQQGLFISTVVHKAFVNVDEVGTEAAAATGVVMDVNDSASVAPVSFRADHPFLFLIRHNATGSLLFMGRVVDPRAN